MQEVINALRLSSQFMIVILFIILMGIIVLEFFKKRKKGWELGFLLFLLIFYNIKLIFDLYSWMMGDLEYLYSFLNNSFDLLIIGIFYLFIYRYRNKIGNGLISLYVFSTLVLVVGSFLPNSLFKEVLLVIFLFFVSIFVFFLILNFLMNFDKKKKKSKVKKEKIKGVRIVLIIFSIFFVVFFLWQGIFISDKEVILDSELVVYNWEDYLGPSEIVENFEEEFGVNIVLKTFEDEYEMLENFKNNSESYDVVVFSDDLIDDMLSDDLLYPVRRNNIPNLRYIDDICLRKGIESYGVPYFYGDTGIVVNTKYVSEVVDSWGAFWNLDYSSKVGVLSNPSERIGMVSKYIGGSLIPQTESELQGVREWLTLFEEMDVKYASDEKLMGDMISEELWIAQMYDGTAREIMLENKDVVYVNPVEGGSTWIDYFGISKGSRRRETAEVFINYILRPDVSAKITEDLLYSTCNFEAGELVNLQFFEKDLAKFDFFSNYEEVEGVERLRKELLREVNNIVE